MRLVALALPLLALALVISVAVLPSISNGLSYSNVSGELFSLAQAKPEDMHASDFVNLQNPGATFTPTNYTMSSNAPPDPKQQSIFTETFTLNLPYQMDGYFTFAGTSPGLNFEQESVRVSIRMTNGTNVIQQSYTVGRPQNKLTTVNTYLYYSIALPNSTRFLAARNVTSDLEGEGLKPTSNWQIVWVGLGFVRYATVPNTTFAVSFDRNSTVLHSNMIDPVRFSANYNPTVFVPFLLVGAVALGVLGMDAWVDVKKRGHIGQA